MSHPVTPSHRRWLAQCLQRHVEQRLGRTLEVLEDPAGEAVWLRREERDGRYTVRTSVCVMHVDRITVRCIWFLGDAYRFDGVWGLVDNCNPRQEACASAGFRSPAPTVTRRALEWSKALCDTVTGFREAASLLSASPDGSESAGRSRPLDVQS